MRPRFTEAITDKGVKLTTDEVLRADTVIVSIGDAVKLGLLTDANGTWSRTSL